MLLRNSHTPSVAKTTKRSSSVSVVVLISGSANTPTLSAARSPNDRAMASPGMSMFLRHTRGTPHSKTRPPLPTMRASSSGRLGLWSSERSTAVSLPVQAANQNVRVSTQPVDVQENSCAHGSLALWAVPIAPRKHACCDARCAIG